MIEDHCEDETSLDVPNDYAIVTFDISNQNNTDEEVCNQGYIDEEIVSRVINDSGTSSKIASRPLSSFDLLDQDDESDGLSEVSTISLPSTTAKSPRIMRTRSSSSMVDENACLVTR